MEPILTIDNLNSFGGNMLRQGDKSQLKYRLRDVGNKNLAISSKPCQVKMYGRNYTTVVYETSTTVSSENTVTFTIDKVLPKGTFYLEFTVGDYIFPTDHREFFEITPSGKGMEANIIEIVGKDVLIQAVKSQVDTELQPLVTSLESAEQAEAQRVTAESTRVSAEAQRKTDHANRSAELAGKADKVVIKNLIENGDVESSYTFETSSYINFLKTGGIVGPLNYSNAQSIIPAISGHEYYVRAVFSQGTVRERLYFIYEDNSANFNDGVLVETDMVSGIITAIKTANANLRMYGSAGEKTKKSIMMIDLTETFGVGNEPTKEEMDELIKVTGYIDGEYALNNKEMLGHLMSGIREKANKKQEDWITPTLTNGATGDIQFRKNQFGRVEFRGRMTGHQGSGVFVLPIGYRPLTQFRTLAKVNTGATEVRTMIISNTGSVHFEQPYGTSEVYFDTISFSTE